MTCLPSLSLSLDAPPERTPRPLEECSACVLRLVLGLALDPAAAARALAEISGETIPAPLSDAAVLRRLVRAVREDAGAAPRVARILEARVKSEVRRYEKCSPCELAELWAAARHSLRVRSLAALLLTVARSREPAFRRLEARLVEEIETEAIRSLVVRGAPAARAAPAVPAMTRRTDLVTTTAG